MRIFIGGRIEGAIENDKRITKFNYGLQTHCSIENAIIEKRLMHALAIRDGKKMMHNISDLEAWCDHQLPNIECMVEESAGVEREPEKLFAKILPVMNHHKCTSYGISKESYGSGSHELGGTGQGNSVSEEMCKDTP